MYVYMHTRRYSLYIISYSKKVKTTCIYIDKGLVKNLRYICNRKYVVVIKKDKIDLCVLT